MRSLPGMWMAFCALFLIMGIYGIIGVNFWRDTYPEYYGSFLKAVLSLLQIMSFDSWCSGIAREIIFDSGTMAAFYFVSYVFIASIVMANVLVALLLDEFMSVSQDEEIDDALMDAELERLSDEMKGEVGENVTVTSHTPITANNSPGGESESGMIVLGNIILDDQEKSQRKRADLNTVSPYVHQGVYPNVKCSDSSHWQRAGGRDRQGNQKMKLCPPESLEWKSSVEQHIGALTERTGMLNSDIERMNEKIDIFISKITDILAVHFEEQLPTEMNDISYPPNEVRRRIEMTSNRSFSRSGTRLRL